MSIPDLLAYRLPVFDQALASLPAAPIQSPGEDESYWHAVRALYATSNSPVNLENGFWGAMAEPVKAMFQYWTDRVNFENTALIRPHWPQLLEGLRHEVAHALGCEADEIVLTRGATESMLALISGYRHLKPGDTVLYGDLDYPAMRHAMEWLRERRGVTPVRLTLPEPATHDAVIDTYARALRDHPGTKLVLLTHLSHSTGLVLPVAELADLARAAGADVIVDAAHSWGQMDFKVADLNARFAAFNLHKWVGAPLGCGCLYIQRGHVTSIDRYFGDRDFPRGRHSGSHSHRLPQLCRLVDPARRAATAPAHWRRGQGGAFASLAQPLGDSGARLAAHRGVDTGRPTRCGRHHFVSRQGPNQRG